jgi:hypothetical protein
MTNTRLYRENVTIALALPEAFADWEAPTAAELNGALVFNITCALNEDGTTFDLGDSDTDGSLSFCQAAGSVSPTFYNPSVTLEAFRSDDATASDMANEAFGLLAFPDIEYFAVLRVVGEPDAVFATGNRVSLVRVKTDYPVDTAGAGENIRISNSMLSQGDVNWNYEIAA